MALVCTHRTAAAVHTLTTALPKHKSVPKQPEKSRPTCRECLRAGPLPTARCEQASAWCTADVTVPATDTRQPPLRRPKGLPQHSFQRGRRKRARPRPSRCRYRSTPRSSSAAPRCVALPSCPALCCCLDHGDGVRSHPPMISLLPPRPLRAPAPLPTILFFLAHPAGICRFVCPPSMPRPSLRCSAYMRWGRRWCCRAAAAGAVRAAAYQQKKRRKERRSDRLLTRF